MEGKPISIRRRSERGWTGGLWFSYLDFGAMARCGEHSDEQLVETPWTHADQRSALRCGRPLHGELGYMKPFTPLLGVP